MNRDMDVIRKIVLESMDCNEPISSIDGISDSVFGFHAQLLEEAGLVKCIVSISGDEKYPVVDFALIYRLTWNGFDFAQSIKDDTVWNKARECVMKPAASWTFGLLIEFLKVEVKEKLGIQ